MGRQSEKMIKKDACKFKHFSDQNCQCKLYRYKVIAKRRHLLFEKIQNRLLDANFKNKQFNNDKHFCKTKLNNNNL